MQYIIRKGLIDVSPMYGKILGGKSQKFIVKICPGMPSIIDEKFNI